MLVYSDTDPRIKRYLGYRSKLGILHHKIKQLKKIKLNKKSQVQENVRNESESKYLPLSRSPVHPRFVWRNF